MQKKLDLTIWACVEYSIVGINIHPWVREECDIDDGDGTRGLANAKDRESLDLNVETATHGASGDSRDGKAR